MMEIIAGDGYLVERVKFAEERHRRASQEFVRLSDRPKDDPELRQSMSDFFRTLRELEDARQWLWEAQSADAN